MSQRTCLAALDCVDSVKAYVREACHSEVWNKTKGRTPSPSVRIDTMVASSCYIRLPAASMMPRMPSRIEIASCMAFNASFMSTNLVVTILAFNYFSIFDALRTLEKVTDADSSAFLTFSMASIFMPSSTVDRMKRKALRFMNSGATGTISSSVAGIGDT